MVPRWPLLVRWDLCSYVVSFCACGYPGVRLTQRTVSANYIQNGMTGNVRLGPVAAALLFAYCVRHLDQGKRMETKQCMHNIDEQRGVLGT